MYVTIVSPYANYQQKTLRRFDMVKTHYKKLRNTNYLGSWDLTNGDKVVKIKKVSNVEVFNPSDNAKEECVVAELYNEKPLILNSTNLKSIEKALGSPYIEDWVGKEIQLYTKKVKAFGDIVDAIRVRETKPKEAAKILCENCGGEIYAANKMSPEDLAVYTQTKYGKKLCAKCAVEANKKLTSKEDANE